MHGKTTNIFLFKKHYIQLNWITHKKKKITVQIIILNIQDKMLHPTRLRTIWGLGQSNQIVVGDLVNTGIVFLTKDFKVELKK
jgi:hypothetical protein